MQPRNYRKKQHFKFTYSEIEIELPIGGKYTLPNGDVLQLKRYSKKWSEFLDIIWYNINGGHWGYMELGRRTHNGRDYRDFELTEIK